MSELKPIDRARVIHKLYPLIWGAVIGGLSILVFTRITIPKTAAALINSMPTLAAISIGFLTTAKSVLLGMKDVEFVKLLRQSTEFKSIIADFKSAIRWSFLLAVYSAVLMFFDFDKQPVYMWALASFWVFFTCVATLTYYRVLSQYYEMIAE